MRLNKWNHRDIQWIKKSKKKGKEKERKKRRF